jgi:Peptidase A4 family
MVIVAGALGIVLLGLPGSALASTPAATSTGWAGYYLSGANGAFSSVSATWTVPTAKCVAGDQYAAFWTGLDGVASDSVEQVGIDADCTSKTASYLGWYDMYPADPVYFSNAIAAGDSMSASVTFSGADTYTLKLADSTADWSHTVTENESGLARSSAEVVTEGPGSAGILTDFGKITYAGCTVNGTSMGTQDPTAVTMVDASGKVMVSTSTITAAGKFTNTWLRGS